VVKKHETVKFSITQEELVPFKITEYYWIVENKKTETGNKTAVVFKKPGTYRVTLGVVGDPENPKEKRCVYKEIVVK